MVAPMRLFLVFAAAVLAGGCSAGMVIVDGKPTERLRFDFTGQPFVLHHVDAHPRPGGASNLNF